MSTRPHLPIVDVDSHYAENIDGLWEYMPEPWHTRLRGEGGLTKFIPASLGTRWVEDRIDGTRQLVDTDKFDPVDVQQGIVRAMERLGIQATVLVPNKLTLLGHLSVRDVAVVASNAHVDYHLDKVADAALGIYTMPVITWHDPEAGAALIERVGDHPAVCGVCVTTSHANPPWGDVRYNPIYEAAERMNLPIVLHADSGLTLTEQGSYADGLQRLIEAHSLGFLVSNQIQLTSLIYQGVPVRFPNLKIVFLEAGIFYVPAMMYRLDEYFLKRRSEAPLLEALPSEYITERFYFGTQPIEMPRNMDAVAAIFDMADGRNRFMYASDYPHWDYDEPMVIDRLNFLTTEDKARVFALNALDVFNFTKGGPQPWQRTVSELLPSSLTPAESSSR